MSRDEAVPTTQPAARKQQPEVGRAVAVLVPRAASPGRRAGGRAGRRVFASRRARLEFLDALTRIGDPARAAEATRLSLVKLFRLRAEDADFAAEWHAALGFAWERIEHRVLAQLLDPATPLDSKLAQAVIARRVAGQNRAHTRTQGRRVDSVAVARLRAELRALTEAEQPEPVAAT